MLLKDFGYAARSLRKNPAVLVTAAVTIGLGIGASTAIFSVANAVLLRPLPYKDAERLIVVGGDMRTRTTYDQPLSNENYQDLVKGSTAAFEEFAALNTFRNVLPRKDGTSEQVRVAQVTHNFFSMMGARIEAGRDFDANDAVPQPPPDPNAPPPPPGTPPPLPAIAILSHDYFAHQFGGDRSILGHPLLGGVPGSPIVVGVLAPGFELLFKPDANIERVPDYYIAARLNYDNRNRNGYFLRPVGRLRAGISLTRADEAAELASVDIRKNFPIYGAGNFHFHLEPMQQHLVSEVRPAILALTGAVTFLFLIACANVANLLLVRTSLRERELAVRAALGASAHRLITQLLAESFLLAAAGILLGLGLARIGITELISISPSSLPRLDQIAIDPTVLMFSILAGAAAAILFGLAPALRASRPDIIGMLRGSGRTAGLGSGGLRNIVAIAEVSLSFVLLIGSGLMVRSFLELQRIDPGYDSRNLLTFQLLRRVPPGQPPAQRAAYQRDLEARLRAIGGVQAVTATGPLPLTGGFSAIRWGKEAALTDPSKYQSVDWQTVLPGYFETLRTPVVAGRTFTEADNTPDRNYVLVDTVLANKAFPNESPLGKRILVRLRAAEPEWVEIIGVVAHQRQESIAELGREQIYFTDGYVGHSRANQWALRTSGDPAALSGAVRAEVARFDPKALVKELQPMSQWVEAAQASTRFSLLLISVFAGVAALLASIGLYGVLSTFVRQRTPEIGVRMAMGATPANVFSMVVGQGLRLSAIGVGVGLLAALALTRLMSTMLVGVQATDPITFAGIVAFFFAIAVLACYVPARRAARLDPTVALRD